MLKLTTDKHEASRGLSATAELVIILSLLDPGIEKRDAGIVEVNVPLDTLYVISETVLWVT